MNSSFSFSKDTVGFLVDGVLDEERLEKLNDKILRKLEQYESINLYLEDNGIEKFTLPAIVKEIAFKVEHASQLNRVALVTDRKWVKACAAIENSLLSSEIQTFSIEDRMQAMCWITQR
ncbi:MAG: STAS/SEC14 domain-containing protein [Marinirhabdus sp.]|nr:STAS/SEC14 domain-containing protein [Marinirhabdus sp.]